MTPFDPSNSLMLGALGGLVQGVLLGILLTAAAALLVKYVLRLNASTRFAVWLAAIPILCVITVLPAMRHDEENPVTSQSRKRAPLVTTVAAASVPEVMRPSKPVGQPETPFHLQLPVDRELPLAAANLYILVVFCLAVRLLFGYLHLRRLKGRSNPAPPELAARFDNWLLQAHCSRRVELRVSPDARGPLAAGYLRPAVIVPKSLLLGMTGDEIDDIGLHELSHFRRCDDWTTLLQRLIRMLFFFHPAVHWVCRQLEFDREVACDDSVLSVTRAARSYARSLTKVSELKPSGLRPVLASGAVFGKSHIRRRIELLLNAARDRTPRVSAMSFALVVLVVIGIASDFAAMPAFVSLVDGGSHFRSRWSVNGRTVQFDMSGDVEFADDDISVVHMSPNALVRVEEWTGWSGRKVEIRNGSAGTPEVRYFLHGNERPLDEPGRAWLAAILPRVIRDSGLQAEERARRILDRGGPGALLQEIDRITSDHSKRRYLITGIQSGKFGTDAMQQALRSISRMSSDDQKANLLIEVAAETLTPELRGWFFDAVNSISSDHDRRRVLSKAITEGGTELDIAALAARSAQRIGSDHEKSEVLRAMPLDAMLNDAKVRKPLLQAAASIHSDHDKAETLGRMVATAGITPEAIAEIVRVAETIQSDDDKARLLERVSADVGGSTARGAYFAAVRTIQSDNDRARVLQQVLSRTQTSGDLLEEVCTSARGIGSDEQKANVLIAARAPLPPVCYETIRTVGSDHDKRRVLERLIVSNTSPDTARAAVETASTIGSDHDKAEVLIRAAQQRPDEQTRAAIRKVAQSVSSDEDFRRINTHLQDRTIDR